MENLKLSISLVNTNNKLLLRACLHSLYSVDHQLPFETILVDNVSTDASSDMVKSEFPQVELICNRTRKGFGANHNQAIRASRGEYVLVLNEDTIVRPGALRAMCDFLDAHADVGAVGCRLENPDGSLQPSCHRFPSPLRAVAENLLLVAAFPNNPWWGDYRAWSHDRVRYVEFVSGAAIMVRRQVIEDTGVFDERFFIYAEETDWCYRMAKAGWKVAFVPNGTIVHYGGQSSVAIKDRQFCECNRSSVRYFRKHFGLMGVVVLGVTMLLGAAIRVPIWSLIYFASSKRRLAAATRITLWRRIGLWWIGLGPRQGIAELATGPTMAGAEAAVQVRQGL